MASLFKPKTIAIAKMAKLPQYQHPALLSQEFKKPINLQRQELMGEIDYGKGLYHNQNYETLVKNINSTRHEYSTTTSLNTKTQIARDQFSLWDKYVTEGAQNIPESKKISDKQRNQLHQAYIVAKERTEDKVSCHRLLHLHNEYAKGFKWDIELHPRMLLQMVHPHFGYLLNFNNKLSLEELIQFYNVMLFASEERYAGQTLHSDEISAFNFWKLFTSQSTLNLKDFCRLLTMFKFEATPETFEKQFEYTLDRNKGELVRQGNSTQDLRFGLFRSIFLDRGL